MIPVLGLGASIALPRVADAQADTCDEVFDLVDDTIRNVFMIN